MRCAEHATTPGGAGTARIKIVAGGTGKCQRCLLLAVFHVRESSRGRAELVEIGREKGARIRLARAHPNTRNRTEPSPVSTHERVQATRASLSRMLCAASCLSAPLPRTHLKQSSPRPPKSACTSRQIDIPQPVASLLPPAHPSRPAASHHFLPRCESVVVVVHLREEHGELLCSGAPVRQRLCHRRAEALLIEPAFSRAVEMALQTDYFGQVERPERRRRERRCET
eukprot:4583184-Pleurochrysis_carterae.AAC.1